MGTTVPDMSTKTARLAAERVRGLMVAAGESEKSLAERTGIPRATLGRRLTGNSPFTVSELDALADHYATTTAALVSEDVA